MKKNIILLLISAMCFIMISCENHNIPNNEIEQTATNVFFSSECYLIGGVADNFDVKTTEPNDGYYLLNTPEEETEPEKGAVKNVSLYGKDYCLKYKKSSISYFCESIEYMYYDADNQIDCVFSNEFELPKSVFTLPGVIKTRDYEIKKEEQLLDITNEIANKYTDNLNKYEISIVSYLLTGATKNGYERKSIEKRDGFYLPELKDDMAVDFEVEYIYKIEDISTYDRIIISVRNDSSLLSYSVRAIGVFDEIKAEKINLTKSDEIVAKRIKNSYSDSKYKLIGYTATKQIVKEKGYCCLLYDVVPELEFPENGKKINDNKQFIVPLFKM